MRATAGKLHHNGALAAPIAVAAMVDQLPSDTILVEISDDRCSPGRNSSAGAAKGQTAHLIERRVVGKCTQQTASGLLTFPAHDNIEPGLLLQQITPEIGRMYAAIHDGGIWQAGTYRACHAGDDRLPRR